MLAGATSLQELGARAAQAAIPLHALIELTHACNLTCQHCYLSDPSASRELSSGEWRRVFCELAEAGCLFLAFSGGEPFLRQDWFELATHARTLGFALRFLSNGTLVTDELAGQLASLRPLGVDVSLLGAVPATHDELARAPGAFHRTLAGIRTLRGRGVRVLLKAVLMERNAPEHFAMRRLAEELDCDIRFDIEITPKNDGDLRPTLLSATGCNAIEAMRCQVYERLDALPARAPQDRAALLEHGPCRAGRSTCHITPYGDVTPCTQWLRPSGNLRTRAFREIWRDGADFVLLRRLRLTDLQACARCNLLEVCSPCPGLNLLENGDFAVPAPTKCRSARVRAQALGDATPPGRP